MDLSHRQINAGDHGASLSAAQDVAKQNRPGECTKSNIVAIQPIGFRARLL